jgi:hypothetical protein
MGQARVPLSYKTDDLVLDVPHRLPLYSFRVYCHFVEGVKSQAFSSYRSSPRLVAVAFYTLTHDEFQTLFPLG